MMRGCGCLELWWGMDWPDADIGSELRIDGPPPARRFGFSLFCARMFFGLGWHKALPN